MNEIEILVKRYPELLVAKDDILKAYIKFLETAIVAVESY